MRAQKTITLSNGASLVVWQANYDMSLDREAIEQHAQTLRASQNGSGDKSLLFFQEIIYSGLAAFSTGEVPLLLDAFNLPPQDLDNWHLEIAKINPNLFIVREYIEKDIEIGNRKIKVLSNRPSVMMKRVYLESEAEKQPAMDNVRKEFFRLSQYPRLAGCSVGDVPAMQEALIDLSVEELDTWYKAAREVLPAWFETQDETIQRETEQQKEDKKKSRRHARKS